MPRDGGEEVRGARWAVAAAAVVEGKGEGERSTDRLSQLAVHCKDGGEVDEEEKRWAVAPAAAAAAAVGKEESEGER